MIGFGFGGDRSESEKKKGTALLVTISNSK